MARVPRLSHQQFLVVGALQRGALAGREVRAVLAEYGARKSGPAFYQMMARMEDAGLVSGEYEQEIVEGQIIRERHYRLTGAGLEAWRGCRTFYLTALDAFGDGVARA